MKKKTGIIVSFESSEKGEIENALKLLSDSVDAVLLKEPVLLRESIRLISEMKNFMRKNGFDKPIIIDSRLAQEELDSMSGLSSLLKNEGASGMTIAAVYNEGFIKSCKKQAGIELFAVVDISTKFFYEHFDDNLVMKNAISAKDNKCAGVVMTSRHLDRIRKVKKIIENDLQLLATVEKENKVGDAASAGADFEIAPYKLLK